MRSGVRFQLVHLYVLEGQDPPLTQLPKQRPARGAYKETYTVPESVTAPLDRFAEMWEEFCKIGHDHYPQKHEADNVGIMSRKVTYEGWFVEFDSVEEFADFYVAHGLELEDNYREINGRKTIVMYI